MGNLGYLTALRRQWHVVLVCVLVAGLVGWFTAPTGAGASKAHTATVTLIPARDSQDQVNLFLAASLATSRDVANNAAAALQYTGDPSDLIGAVTAVPDADAGAVTLTASDADPQRAAALVSAFGAGVMDFLSSSVQVQRDLDRAETQQALEGATQRINDLEAQIAGADQERVGVLRAQRDAELARYGTLYSQLQQLSAAAPTESGLQILGSPTVVASRGGLPVPTRPVPRGLVFALVGLMLGAIAAVVISRLDTRLRRRPEVEAAFDAPVLSEIPRIKWGSGRKEIFVQSRSHSVDAEAFRSLRFAILRQGGRRASGNSRRPATTEPSRVIMVSSIGSREGKSTTTANLAAALAEVGMTVLVIDCDLRNPEMHTFLDANGTVGLSELLEKDDDIDLASVARQTSVPGVRLVTNGSTPGTTASLVMRFADVIASARRTAGIVLVDSAPLLVASESLDLAQHVDAALIVTRAGRDTAEKAGQLVRLLNRAETPVLGVVLVGVSRPSTVLPSRGSAAGRSDLPPVAHRQSTTTDETGPLDGPPDAVDGETEPGTGEPSDAAEPMPSDAPVNSPLTAITSGRPRATSRVEHHDEETS